MVRSGKGNRLHVSKRSHVIAHAGSYVMCLIMGSRDNFEISFEFTASSIALVTGRTDGRRICLVVIEGYFCPVDPQSVVHHGI